MGKRSRRRPGPVKGVGSTPTASKRAAAAAAAGPDAGPVQRAKASWRAAGDVAPQVVKVPGQKPQVVRPKSSSVRTGKRGGGTAAAPERPPALWGSAPISELAIGVGLLMTGIGLAQGPGSALITGGLVFVTIAVIEFAGREHLRGFKSHTLFLSMMIVIALHLGLATIVGADTARSPGFIAGDALLFVLLASGLHKQFSIARAEKALPQRSR